MGVEMSQEYNETNGALNDEVHKENLIEIHGRVLPPRRTEFKEVILGRSRWMKRSITIYGRDHAAFHESSLPLNDRPIISERLRCEFIM